MVFAVLVRPTRSGRAIQSENKFPIDDDANCCYYVLFLLVLFKSVEAVVVVMVVIRGCNVNRVH